jgi:hypothetical protein
MFWTKVMASAIVGGILNEVVRGERDLGVRRSEMLLLRARTVLDCPQQ